jgi:hypothetical protein
MFVQVLSITGAVASLVGWIGMTFGPRSLFLFGMAGFLCGIVGRLVPRGPAVATAEPRAPRRRALRGFIRVLAAVFVVGLVATFVNGIPDGGVSGMPAFQNRPTYELNDHGRRTNVSRTRYVLLGVSFATCWTAMALVANLSTLYRTLYGEQAL